MLITEDGDKYATQRWRKVNPGESRNLLGKSTWERENFRLLALLKAFIYKDL